MTTAAQIVRAACPEASDLEVDHVLWGRTPFPFGKVSPRDLYKAASSITRASRNGLTLCEHCHRIARPGKWDCDLHHNILEGFRQSKPAPPPQP